MPNAGFKTLLRKSSKFVEALLDDKVALDATILEWIERYEEDNATAMTEMVNFILRVSMR